MHKYKELLKNIGILTIGSLGSKILVFLLVPLYTSVLSTSDYGIFDIIYSAIVLLFPFLTLNVSEGATRFLLDKKTSQNNICKGSFGALNISVLILSILVALNNVFHVFPLIEPYSIYIILFYISYAYYVSSQNIARGLDRIKDVSISGIINIVFILLLNITCVFTARISWD